MTNNSASPVAVIQTKLEYSDSEIETASATLRALLPREMLVLLSYHLQGMNRERAHGQLNVAFNMYGGQARTADFNRTTHWAPPPKKEQGRS